MDDDEHDYVSLESIERWWGTDIVSGAPDTALVTIRGRGPQGEPMSLTLRHDDFERVVEAVRSPWHLDMHESLTLAAKLILQHMASPPG
jgi:hypothetical protein